MCHKTVTFGKRMGSSDMTRLLSLSLVLAAAVATPAMASTPTLASIEAKAQIMPNDGGARLTSARGRPPAGWRRAVIVLP